MGTPLLMPKSRLALGRLYVGCLHAFAAFVVLDLESDFVTFIERESCGLEGRGVYENVFFAILGRDEAEAARLIEKFDCACEAHCREFLSREGSLPGLEADGPLGV